MATRKAPEGGQVTTAPEPTLSDVLGAVRGVGQKVEALDNKVASIDRRVTALERAPSLKTRIVQQTAPTPVPSPNGRGGTSSARIVQQQDPQAEGEDEAIASGTWEKVVKTSRCYKVGITKTRNRDSWKIKMYLRGQRRPAAMVGWDGTAALIEFMREVWPEISEDHFDEDTFAKEDKGKDIPVEFQFEGVHFLVDWFRTAPNYRGHTFINVEGVYPIGD